MSASSRGRSARTPKPRPVDDGALAAADEARLQAAIGRVEDEPLRDALDRLGRGVLKRHKEA